MTRVQRDRLAAIRHLYAGNPDVAWLADRVDAALDTADFLDSYTDDTALAAWSPVLLDLMRDHASILRGER